MRSDLPSQGSVRPGGVICHLSPAPGPPAHTGPRGLLSRAVSTPLTRKPGLQLGEEDRAASRDPGRSMVSSRPVEGKPLASPGAHSHGTRRAGDSASRDDRPNARRLKVTNLPGATEQAGTHRTRNDTRFASSLEGRCDLNCHAHRLAGCKAKASSVSETQGHGKEAPDAHPGRGRAAPAGAARAPG